MGCWIPQSYPCCLGRARRRGGTVQWLPPKLEKQGAELPPHLGQLASTEPPATTPGTFQKQGVLEPPPPPKSKGNPGQRVLVDSQDPEAARCPAPGA